MSQLELNSFLASPSLSVVDSCRKDDLAQMAIHFGLIVPKSILKRELKALVISKSVQVELVKKYQCRLHQLWWRMSTWVERLAVYHLRVLPALTLMWRVAVPLVKRQR